MFWTHWNLSALRSFYGLAASASQTEYTEREIYGKKSKTLVVPMYLYEGWTLIMLS
jgi:hypothetical protein